MTNRKVVEALKRLLDRAKPFTQARARTLVIDWPWNKEIDPERTLDYLIGAVREAEAALAALDEDGEGRDLTGLRDRIADTLERHPVSGTEAEMGGRVKLVDWLTPPDYQSIERGVDECALMADEVTAIVEEWLDDSPPTTALDEDGEGYASKTAGFPYMHHGETLDEAKKRWASEDREGETPIGKHVYRYMDDDPSICIGWSCEKCGVTTDPECDYGGWHDHLAYLRASEIVRVLRPEGEQHVEWLRRCVESRPVPEKEKA